MNNVGWPCPLSVLIREGDGRFNLVLTGVEREYRGRGIALAVKVKSAEHAKNNGGEILRTFNDSTNDRILRVKQRMGFTPRPGSYGVDKVLL